MSLAHCNINLDKQCFQAVVRTLPRLRVHVQACLDAQTNNLLETDQLYWLKFIFNA